MDRYSDGFIHSGASPEEVAADLEPLFDFQDEGLPLEQLEKIIEERLFPHFVRYDLPEFMPSHPSSLLQVLMYALLSITTALVYVPLSRDLDQRRPA